MSYTWFDFFQLIGSLGIFIYGMKILSEGLQKMAGSKLKTILGGMTKNRAIGVVTGLTTTAITQSSTTTTVMAVSFVNAGLLSFVQATGVIMGANIGTTVTAWMVALFGFKFEITSVALALIGLFFGFLFAKSPRMRNIAETIVGFGILFIGLSFIKAAVPDINENPEILQFLQTYSDYGYLSLLIFVAIGTILTLVTQSSSASTAITLVMLFEGWISFDIAAAMVLGENIGTTVTASLAALSGNVHAKRTARFHVIFNVVGVIWMLLIIYPFLNIIDTLIQYFTQSSLSVFDSSSSLARANATLGLSLFHTAFNLINVCLLFFFVPYIVRFLEYITPEKEGEEEFSLQYISAGPMVSPGFSVEQANKEIQHFVHVIEKMHLSLHELIFDEKSHQSKLLHKIARYEELTDRLEAEISNYLVRISANANLESSLTARIRFMQNMINDLERIADIYYQLSKQSEKMTNTGSSWPDSALSEMSEMMEAVGDALQAMTRNVSLDPELVSLDEALELEDRIDYTRELYRDNHYTRLEGGEYASRAGVLFVDMLNRLERIGDHILNVNEAAAGKRLYAVRMGDQESNNESNGSNESDFHIHKAP